MGHTEQPREHTLSLYSILALASITPSTSRDLGAPLALSLKLVPPTTSTPVQVIQCLPFCWTYVLLGRNQDKLRCHCIPLVSTIWGQEHVVHLLVGARPRGPDTDSWRAR